MNANVTLGTTDPGPFVPSPSFRDALAEAAGAHAADLIRRRSSALANSRALTSMEEKRLGEVASNVRCQMRLPCCLVLANEWWNALERLSLRGFRASTVRGPRVHAVPGRYILRDEILEAHERDWLETAVVEAVHVEACGLCLEHTLELSPAEVALATQHYQALTAGYERIVQVTAIYNVLAWWCAKFEPRAMLGTRYEEQCIQAASTSLEACLASTSEVPLEEQYTGPFILPRGRFMGEPLTLTHIREALVGDRFARVLRGLE